jgi:uncharacterized circularly permuted ATP-grasp superfamily protein
MSTRRGSADAVQAYNELLQAAPLADASLAALRLAQARPGMSFGDRPVSVSLRPNLLTRPRWEASTAAARAVYGALRTLEKALLRDRSLRSELDLSPEEEQLAMAETGCRPSSQATRLDSFFGREVRYVEYNAESPAGMAYGDSLTTVFDSLPVMRAFRRRFAARALPARGRQLSCMLRSFREWGRDAEPVVAIVDWEGLPTAGEFELFSAFFAARGVRSLICDPRALSFHRGALYAGSVRVNLVYRRVLTSELLARRSEAPALIDAYLAGAACVVNTFRAKLLHKKMAFALLSDDRHRSLYPALQRAAIDRHVPWTRRVRDGSSTRRGRPLRDLVTFVARNRARLVLKPNDEYGGRGVVLGWTVEQEAWERALSEALRGCYVVQEAVEVPREPFPVALEDGVRVLDLAIDLNPYLFHGRPGGVMTRLSSSALMNVTAGAGSVVPTYVVEEAR